MIGVLDYLTSKELVYMQHSKEDQQVPFVTAEMTARLLPNCRFEVREKGEHFSKEILDQFFKAVVAEYIIRQDG